MSSEHVPIPLHDFTLGEWLVQPSRNRLSRGDTVLHFRPKVMDVLVFLASHAGEVVSKESIIDSVWAKEFIADSTFSRAIFELRESLGDDSQHPTYLETIAKRGYRLVAPVEFREVPASDPRPAAEPRARFAWGVVLGVGIALVVLGQLLVSANGSRSDAGDTGSDHPGVAVFPFENVGAPGDEYFALGVTDEIRGRLAATRGLRVVGVGDGAVAGDGVETIRDIAARLGVDYLLSGTVRWDSSGADENRVRITPRLVRGVDGKVLWAETYDRRADDIFRVQSEIARNVIARLELTVSGGEAAAADEVAGVPSAGYQAYLRGYHHVRRPDGDPNSLRLAVQLFTRAIEIAPEFARAWSERAKVQARLFHLGVSGSPTYRTNAHRDVERAVALAPHDPTVRLSRALVLYWCDRNYEEALRELEEARRKGSRPEDVWQAEAWMLRRLGRWDEAVVRLMATLGLSPDNAQVMLELGITSFSLRRYEEAERAFERTIALAPDEGFGYYYKAWNVRCWRGDLEEARRILEAAPVVHDPREASEWFEQEVLEGDLEAAVRRIDLIDPDGPQLACEYCSRDLRGALVLALLGRTDEARARYDEALDTIEQRLQADPEDARFVSGRAVTLAGLGRGSEALREAERAVELCPIARDALSCICPQIHLALVLGMVGDEQRACTVLDGILEAPAPLSTHILRADPRWRVVTRHPCFAELERKYPSGGATL